VVGFVAHADIIADSGEKVAHFEPSPVFSSSYGKRLLGRNPA
jgi:hypothetical protein